MVSNTELMIVEPPGEPATSDTLPSRNRIVGAIDESMRLPGWISFAEPGCGSNRFMASFSTMPVPGTVTAEPLLHLAGSDTPVDALRAAFRGDPR